MSTKLQTALVDAGADLVKIVTTWALAALSIQGVTFGSLITQKALIGLAIALLLYVGAWASNYRKTGNVDPPPAMISATTQLIPGDHLATEGHIQALEALIHDMGDRVINTVLAIIVHPGEQPPMPAPPPPPALETFHTGEAGPGLAELPPMPLAHMA